MIMVVQLIHCFIPMPCLGVNLLHVRHPSLHRGHRPHNLAFVPHHLNLRVEYLVQRHLPLVRRMQGDRTPGYDAVHFLFNRQVIILVHDRFDQRIVVFAFCFFNPKNLPNLRPCGKCTPGWLVGFGRINFLIRIVFVQCVHRCVRVGMVNLFICVGWLEFIFNVFFGTEGVTRCCHV